jgi:hypothetical protein
MIHVDTDEDKQEFCDDFDFSPMSRACEDASKIWYQCTPKRA